MWSAILTAIWLPLLIAGLGAALLKLALRGRRIDDHPLCRKCGFDLSGAVGLSETGSPPAQSQCPECGSVVTALRGIRIGHRRAVRPLAVVGALALAVGILWTASICARRFGGPGLWAYLPTPVLIHQAERGDAPDQNAAIKELLDRLQAGSLTNEHLSTLASIGLRLQSDWGKEWNPGWAKFIIDADVKALLEREQMEQFALNGVELHVHARRSVHEGERLPIQVTATSHRLGAWPTGTVQVGVRDATATNQAGVEVAQDPGGGAMGIALPGLSNGGASAMMPSLHFPLPPGTYTARIPIVIAPAFGIPGASKPQAVRVFESSFEVVSRSEPIISVIDEPRAVTEARAALRVTDVKSATTSNRSQWIYVQSDELKHRIAAEAWLRPRNGSPEVRISEFALEPREGRHHFGFGFDPKTPIPSGPFDVVVRTSVPAAEHRVGFEEIVDFGELVFPWESLKSTQPHPPAPESLAPPK